MNKLHTFLLILTGMIVMKSPWYIGILIMIVVIAYIEWIESKLNGVKERKGEH